MADRDVTNPQDTDIISAYPANERAQRQAQSDIFNGDHIDTDDVDQGKHRQVRMLALAADVPGSAGQGAVYTKVVATITELFYIDSNGTVLQLTNGGLISNPIVNMPEQAADPATPVSAGNLYTKVFNGIAELFWQDELANVIRLTFKGELAIDLSATDLIVGSLRTNNFFRGRRRDIASAAGALAIDMETATVFAFTITENTTATLTNMPSTADGEEQTVYLDITNGGAFTTALASTYTLIRPDGVTKPFTVAGRDMIILSTHDGTTIFTDTVLNFS